MLSDEVLKTLEERKGEYVSGAELARLLDVSRNAVWKAVDALRAEGLDIEASTRKGYRLGGDALTLAGIKKYLKSGGYDIKVFPVVTSTNDVARRLAADGAREGTAVFARTQTAGRGRQGRQFFCSDGDGVYFSLILRPKRLERFLTVTAAVAVADGIEEVGGEKTSIKWVNDVYVGGKKCCGILTEAVTDMESGGIEYAVVGVGINARTPRGGFGELEGVAGAALYGVDDALNRVAAAVLDRFAELYSFESEGNIAAYYKKRSFLIGKKVVVVSPDGERVAKVEDIDDDCRLCVRYADGKRIALSAGEVRIKW